MNCPNCKAPMEAGTVYSNRYLFWTPEPSVQNLRRPKDSFRLRPAGDHTRSPFSPNALAAVPQYAAALCRACGTAVFSFETDE